MKETELRVGNLIIINEEVDMITGIWHEIRSHGVSNIFIQAKNDLDYPIKDIKPVLLTKEWLLKFGFRGEDRYFLSPNGYVLMLQKNGVIKFNGLIFNESKRILYVHQLQNLYFAVTQKELTIKN